MASIGLVSCVGQKRNSPSSAKTLYTSALFAKMRRYIESNCERWFILSAKYGLLSPDEIIAPYEETLKSKSRIERMEWADNVWLNLGNILSPNDKVLILAGDKYREYLVPKIRERGCLVEIPLEGLGIGRQLKWLVDNLPDSVKDKDIERFYNLIQKLDNGLKGKKTLANFKIFSDFPKSGIYLFFEPNEYRNNFKEYRVVRVGTHGVSRGSKSTLWNRLRTHRGSNNGLGNHRGSIFRLHVGTALSRKYPELHIKSWSVGQSAKSDIRDGEKQLETKVSAYIGKMSILWLSILDESGPTSDRAYLERNIIGLLSNQLNPFDPPSLNWLGLNSPEAKIRKSGLWNLDFVDFSYSADFLDVFEEYINVTVGKNTPPKYSIAPKDWYVKKILSKSQVNMFGD